MTTNDCIVYYSPTKRFGTKTPCRTFTAIGRVCDGRAYQCHLAPDYIPWRLDVSFLEGKEAPIEPIIEQLSFIKDKKRWGFPFRRGCFPIPREDFATIAEQMSVLIGSI